MYWLTGISSQRLGIAKTHTRIPHCSSLIINRRCRLRGRWLEVSWVAQWRSSRMDCSLHFPGTPKTAGNPRQSWSTEGKAGRELRIDEFQAHQLLVSSEQDFQSSRALRSRKPFERNHPRGTDHGLGSGTECELAPGLSQLTVPK